MYIYMYIYVYTYIHIYLYIHKYTFNAHVHTYCTEKTRLQCWQVLACLSRRHAKQASPALHSWSPFFCLHMNVYKYMCVVVVIITYDQTMRVCESTTAHCFFSERVWGCVCEREFELVRGKRGGGKDIWTEICYVSDIESSKKNPTVQIWQNSIWARIHMYMYMCIHT